MKYLQFSKSIKKFLQIILPLVILFFNFGSTGIITAYAAGNDLFADATIIASLPYAPGPLDTTNMHTENTDPNPYSYPGKCEGQGLRNGLATVWYTYNPGGSNVAVFLDTTGSTTAIDDPNNPGNFQYDTYIAVYTKDTNNNLVLYGCNDNPDDATNQAKLAFYAFNSTTYYIQIGEYDGVQGDSHEYPGYNGGSLNFQMTTTITISGNVGISGARVGYTGGSAIANSAGDYVLAIPSGLTSTVTPSLTGAVFTPASKTYNNVTTSKTAENYTAKRTFPNISLWTTDFSYYPQGWRADLHPRVMGDVNGDGRDDAIGFGYGGVLVGLSTGTSFAPVTSWTTDFSYNQGWRMDTYPRMVGDVNGDGNADLVGFGYAGAVVALSNGTNGFAPLSLWTTDFSYYPQGWRANLHPRVTGDVNGDGMDDIVGFGYGGVLVALSTGTSFAPVTNWTTDFSYNQGWRMDLYPRMVADVNGDGNADVVGFGYGGVVVALSNGTNGFAPLSLWTSDFSYASGWRVELHPRMMGDINGDGKADVVGFGYSGVVIALSAGAGFYPASLWTSNFSYNSGWRVELYPRMVGDANGDGLDDLIGFGYSGVYVNK